MPSIVVPCTGDCLNSLGYHHAIEGKHTILYTEEQQERIKRIAATIINAQKTPEDKLAGYKKVLNKHA